MASWRWVQMPCQLRSGFWDLCRSAERSADLEQRGALWEEGSRRDRARDGRGRDGHNRALGANQFRRGLACRGGTHVGQQWSPFVVPVVVRRFPACAVAPKRPLPVRGLFVFDGPSSGRARWRDSRGVDLGDDAHWLRRAQRRRISKLQGISGSKSSCSIGVYLMYSLRHRRAAHSRSIRAPIPRRGNNVPEGRDVKTEATAGTAEELALKLPILEAENLGLRQLLAEVRANRDELREEIDDLRDDRDRWQKLAEQAGPEDVRRRAWFCGRASPNS
jgi:hypothetical protein